MSPDLGPLVMLLVAAFAPQSAPTPPAVKLPVVKANTFHSDVLHLDYAYDGALIPAPEAGAAGVQQAKNETSGTVKQAVDCVTAPLTAVDTTSGVRLLLLTRWDGACLSSLHASGTPASLAASTFRGSLARFGDPQLGSPADYTVANHSAVAINGSVVSTKYGVTFFGAASCLAQGTDIVCWEFLTSDCSRLPAMMAAPVQFDGQQPAALLPATYAPTCK